MEATEKIKSYDWRGNMVGRPLIDPDWRNKPKYSENDFWNLAYSDLGKRYGLNDIREAE